jgi:tetratricopeptide (TPR) repeat protein
MKSILYILKTGFSLLVCTLCLACITACSSAPKQKDEITEKLNKAAEYAQSGNAFYIQGMYERALEFFNLALAYNGAIYNEAGIAQSYNSLGKIYMAQGYLETAEIFFQKAYKMVSDLNEPFVLAQSLNNTGELYLNKGKYTEALEQFQQAFELIGKAESSGDASEIKDKNQRALRESGIISTKAIILHNLGSTYKQQKEADKALDYLNQALTFNLENKKFEEVAANYYMLASVYSEKGDYEQAKAYLLLALENDTKVENSLGIAKDYLALGLINNKLDQGQEAYAFFKRSLFVYHSMASIYPNLTLEVEVKNLLNQLIKTAEKLGKKDEADEYKKNLVGKKD